MRNKMPIVPLLKNLVYWLIIGILLVLIHKGLHNLIIRIDQ
jgi:hypothetical protein